jgi:TonB family protein
LYSGQKEEGKKEAQIVVSQTVSAELLNDLAYAMAESNADLNAAREWAEKAVGLRTESLASLSLATLSTFDLTSAAHLGSEWDTLGWIYFKQGNLPKARELVAAAWMLGQHAEEGDHLAQIYSKLGQPKEAIHSWRLALAADPKKTEIAEHLKEATTDPLPRSDINAELGHERTLKIPDLPKQKASAEFFLIVGKQGFEEAEFIEGSETLKNAAQSIRKAEYAFPFPSVGAKRILRRGILSCSEFTVPSCQLTLLLPSTAMSAKAPPELLKHHVIAPSLVSKVEPNYTESAKNAGIEGAVLFSIFVDEKGLPYDVSVSRSLDPGLDENARKCVLQWRFKPGTLEGHPVTTQANVEVNFRLLQKHANTPEPSASVAK